MSTQLDLFKFGAWADYLADLECMDSDELKQLIIASYGTER